MLEKIAKDSFYNNFNVKFYFIDSSVCTLNFRKCKVIIDPQ